MACLSLDGELLPNETSSMVTSKQKILGSPWCQQNGFGLVFRGNFKNPYMAKSQPPKLYWVFCGERYIFLRAIFSVLFLVYSLSILFTSAQITIFCFSSPIKLLQSNN
jgi:hypothetical protein